jgi:hypothetical protein
MVIARQSSQVAGAVFERALGVAVLLLMFVCAVPPALADDEVTVTIERVEQLECVDETLWWCGSDGDFYAKVVIDGGNFESSPIDDDADISPGWTFRRTVTSRSIGIRIEIWDSDGFLRFGDDHVDITSGGGRSLNLTLNLDSCTFSGGVSGSCGATVTTSGTSDDRARVRFRVDVTPVRLGEVEVIVERLTTLECVDDFLWWCGSSADYYGRIGIDGVEQNNETRGESTQFGNQDDVAAYWRFTRWVNLNRASIPIDVRIMDSDGFLNADDTVDVQPGGGRVLELDLNPARCTISGEATGRCGDILDVGSRIDVSGNQSDRARLQMRVRVYDQPRLYVRCLHSPIWPQPGDTVTFTADTLDANMRPIVADRIELLQPSTGTGNVRTCTNASTCEIRLNAPSNMTFSYQCRADERGVAATTGRRTSIIGPPATGRAVPVVQHQTTDRAMDLVFIADSDNYASANAATFSNDVHRVIRDAYLSDELFLRNQGRFNFWIAQDLGDAHGFNPPSPCQTAPANWATDYTFADSGVLLHTDNLRDCASGGIFSTEPGSTATVRHETGHSPFGLADEYCCDGGYFQTGANPNLYGPDPAGSTTALAACQADALAGLRSSCIGFTSTRVSSGSRFFRLDHAPAPGDEDVENDRMVDNKLPRAADERRIQAIINALP